jgi:hypothetical protein
MSCGKYNIRRVLSSLATVVMAEQLYGIPPSLMKRVVAGAIRRYRLRGELPESKPAQLSS